MPCAVTAFSVKIASPGDEGMELVMARQVIDEWNACHSLEQKKVLIPRGQSKTSTGEASSGDLWVAFFCAAHGTPDESFSLALEKRIEAGLPVLIYFSQGRVDFNGVPARRERELDQLRQRFSSRTPIDSFGDEKEFCAKFARDLETLVDTHAHFQTGAPPQSAIQSAPPPCAKALSQLARELLIEACEDTEAYIGHVRDGDTLKIQANGKQLVEQGRPEVAARWESAFEELVTGGYIRDAGCQGRLFQISTKGFEFLKSIGKTPIGYIAELGGM